MLLSVLFLTACSEKEILPSTPSNGKPAQVTGVEQVAVPGGVTVRYRIPDDENILGVKAVYTISNGETIEKMASFYNDEMTLEGYIDEEEHTALLYTVDRSMALSDPVSVTFRPERSALSKAAASMTIERDFGGAQFTWTNEDKGLLYLDLLSADAQGRIIPMKVLTTSSEAGMQALHGYDTEPRWFAAVFRDRFGNASDTIFPRNELGERMKIVPLYEEKIDKSGMSIMLLNNDVSFTKEGTNENLIDDNYENYGHTDYSGCLPAAVTIDLGQMVKVSRLVINARPYNGSYFSWGNPRLFSVFTCDHRPAQDGDWSEWDKVMDCEVVKPSGLEGKDTDEDLAAGVSGAEFSFPLEAGPTRYLRLNVTRVWTNNTFCHIAEITVYGDPNME